MARLHDGVFDCRHPASLARFWAVVLDGYAVAPYDDEELARLRGLGVRAPDRPTPAHPGPPHPAHPLSRRAAAPPGAPPPPRRRPSR